MGYDQEQALCLARDAGEDEKMQLYLQAIARAGRQGQLDEGEIQHLFNLRAERDQEKQWLLAEAQRGLVQTGSPTAMAELAAAGQRAADVLTHEQYVRMNKEMEDKTKTLALRQKQVEYEMERVMKGLNKREADLAALERGLPQGQHSKKSMGSAITKKKFGH